MKHIIPTAIIITVIILLVFVGWIAFRKSGEGEGCEYTASCAEGLTCINSKCSSGKSGSFCSKLDDCKTTFCTNNVCSNGKDKEPCNTYKDCDEGYLCTESLCILKAPEPTWPKYFTKIELQKMFAGIPPGPDNVPVNSTVFKKTDGINLDVALKSGVSGEMYFDVINPISGKVLFTFPKFTASGLLGRGFPAPEEPGSYQVKVYFKGELVDTIDFTVK